MKKIGKLQRGLLGLYQSCKGRSRKKLGLSGPEHDTDDVRVLREYLRNSSILKRCGPGSYDEAIQTVHALCKFLCPGPWCNRSHCKDYHSFSAYHCRHTRPSVCAAYKKYQERLSQKQVKCLRCNGRGMLPMGLNVRGMKMCPSCGGTGFCSDNNGLAPSPSDD